MGGESISSLKICNSFKTWNKFVSFMLNIVISISKHVKNHPSIENVEHLCEIA